jgi:CheY-like chemotaxis protein
MRNLKPILLVEDDSVDAMSVERALKDIKVGNPLAHRVNGEEALKYLREETSQMPCVILLDLNMPKMNGIEFLKIAKADAVLKRVPVVVLTTSKEEQDIVETFDLGVAGYVVKPVDYKKFVEAVRAINLYWTLSEIPTGG